MRVFYNVDCNRFYWPTPLSTTALSHQRHHKPLVATPKLNNWESKSYFIALRNLITYLYLSLEVGVNFMNSKMEL